MKKFLVKCLKDWWKGFVITVVTFTWMTAAAYVIENKIEPSLNTLFGDKKK